MGGTIRELTKPIKLPWPGVGIREAAKIMGRSRGVIQDWRRKGALQVRYERRHRSPEGGWPKVWSDSPLDPNHDRAEPPHRIWGSLWQGLWQRLPEQFELQVKRVPSFRQFRGFECFRGWKFVCPGRMDENEQFKGCGRECFYLYGPQSVWTVGAAMDIQDGFDLPAESGLAGQWIPGAVDPVQSTGPRTFACKACWQLRSACLANRNGWNDFITHITGGLLCGREVERPESIAPVVRKRREYTRRPNQNKARDERAAVARSA